MLATFAAAAAIGGPVVCGSGSSPRPSWSPSPSPSLVEVATAADTVDHAVRRDDVVETRWYRCLLGGAPCGRMVERTESLDDGIERSRTELVLRFERQGVTTTATIRTEIDVDRDGRPRRMRLEQSLGDEPNATEWVFDDDGVREIRTQGRRRIESRLQAPEGDWHLPGPAFEIARRTATVESPVTLRVIDPARGVEPVEVTYRPDGRESVVVGGAVVEGERWKVTEPDGTVTTEVLDPEGRTLISRASMGPGLGDLEIVVADRAAAEAAATGRVELLDAGLVRPTFAGPVRRLDRGDAARYRLDWPDDVPPPPAIGAQRIEAGGGLVVTVETGRGTPVDWADDQDRARHLAPTAALDADDPDVARFARRHDRPRRDDADRAEGLRAAVHRHIDRKGMSTAFAGAGETVRSRAGDCTEHAVLLAAALRAVGLPSRTVSGLVWTPQAGPRDGSSGGAFLWHMWTQAAIDDRWIDLDATLPRGRSFHPGHLAVAVSDGSPPEIESSGRAMLAVFGSIAIEVLPASRTLDETRTRTDGDSNDAPVGDVEGAGR